MKIFFRKIFIKSLILFCFILYIVIIICCDNGGNGEITAGKITYNANGADFGVVPARTTDLIVSDNTGALAKAGYIFDGWNTSPDGNGVNYSVGSRCPERNIILYAKWTAIFFTNISQGTLVPSQGEADKSYTQGVSSLSITGLTDKGKQLSYLVVPSSIDGYSVTAIDNEAFSNCTNIMSITFAEGIINIGEKIFIGCSMLSKVIFQGTSPPLIKTNTFSGYAGVIFVPQDCFDSYKTADNWSNCSERFVEDDSLIENDLIAGPDYEDCNYNPNCELLKHCGIPILNINTLNGSIIDSKTEWKEASLSMKSNFCGYNNLEIEKIQIKGRGNSSWVAAKKSYSIKLSKKTEILGMKKSKRWVLLANCYDKTLLRNYFASRLGNELYSSVWNPSFKFVHLYLNDIYRGVYLLGEQIKIDDNRINIPDISKTGLNDGGFILEIDGRQDEDFYFVTDRNIYFSLKDPDEVGVEIQKKITSIVQDAEDVLFSNDFCNPESGYSKYYNIDSIIDWYIVNELTKNQDAPNNSSIYYYYNPSDKLLYMGPNWDFDLSSGNAFANVCHYNGFYIKEGSPWIKRMFNDPSFVKKVKLRWNKTKTTLYNFITEKIQQDADFISKAADYNYKKWQIIGKDIWPNSSGYRARNTYQKEVNYLINWLKNRYFFMDNALNSLN